MQSAYTKVGDNHLIERGCAVPRAQETGADRMAVAASAQCVGEHLPQSEARLPRRL